MADNRQIVKDFSIMGSTLKPMGNFNASTMINKLRIGQTLALRRQPDNPADKNAVLIMWGQYALGYLPRGLAATIAPIMDSDPTNPSKVICRKAPNALYGVCQLAYIPPLPPPSVPSVPLVPTPAEPEAALLTVEEAEALAESPLYNDPDSVSAETVTEEVPMPTNRQPIRPKSRDVAYDVLDGERDYQDENYPSAPPKTITEFAALIDEYAVKLVVPFTESPETPLTIEQQAVQAKVALKRFREIGAIALHAMEIYGAIPREYHVPASAGITGEMHAVAGADKMAPTDVPADKPTEVPPHRIEPERPPDHS